MKYCAQRLKNNKNNHTSYLEYILDYFVRFYKNVYQKISQKYRLNGLLQSSDLLVVILELRYVEDSWWAPA